MSILRKTIVFLVTIYNALTDYCLRRIQMPAFSISLKGTTEQTTFGHQTNGHSWTILQTLLDHYLLFQTRQKSPHIWATFARKIVTEKF